MRRQEISLRERVDGVAQHATEEFSQIKQVLALLKGNPQISERYALEIRRYERDWQAMHAPEQSPLITLRQRGELFDQRILPILFSDENFQMLTRVENPPAGYLGEELPARSYATLKLLAVMWLRHVNYVLSQHPHYEQTEVYGRASREHIQQFYDGFYLIAQLESAVKMACFRYFNNYKTDVSNLVRKFGDVLDIMVDRRGEPQELHIQGQYQDYNSQQWIDVINQLFIKFNDDQKFWGLKVGRKSRSRDSLRDALVGVVGDDATAINGIEGVEVDQSQTPYFARITTAVRAPSAAEVREILNLDHGVAGHINEDLSPREMFCRFLEGINRGANQAMRADREHLEFQTVRQLIVRGLAQQYINTENKSKKLFHNTKLSRLRMQLIEDSIRRIEGATNLGEVGEILGEAWESNKVLSIENNRKATSGSFYKLLSDYRNPDIQERAFQALADEYVRDHPH